MVGDQGVQVRLTRTPTGHCGRARLRVGPRGCQSHLDQEIIEQRVAARLARHDIFDRRPSPLLSFVMDEAVLRHRYGGQDVVRGQLEHLLLIGEKRNVEIQVMPID
jgi:hypothetical protein